ncbi:uncharacterized protein BXZ73DRAFT_1879, partial [Epithele typhae]|uniref:uncharacterized protein n=1 Tax=Epithele typhae TaxID=378194 RepID=UPI0020078875
YVGLASYTVLVWDHLITLDDEIKYIWERTKNLRTTIYLFFLNRYLTPIAFLGNLYAYLSSAWTPEDICRCSHFVRYEGSMTVIGINTSALMMLFRIHGLYRLQPGATAAVALVFVVELATNAWLLTHGIAVPHSPGIHGCSMIFDPNVSLPRKGVAAAASAWLPLVFDTTVFALTLWKTYSGLKYPTIMRTTRLFLQEGLMYYGVIFCVTLVLTIMILTAPDGIKMVIAHPMTEHMRLRMTVAMMSRITLHMKKEQH